MLPTNPSQLSRGFWDDQYHKPNQMAIMHKLCKGQNTTDEEEPPSASVINYVVNAVSCLLPQETFPIVKALTKGKSGNISLCSLCCTKSRYGSNKNYGEDFLRVLTALVTAITIGLGRVHYTELSKAIATKTK